MALPAPLGVSASGLPPQGDEANAVLSGTIGAVGPTAPFAFRGPMNLALWASINTALTTTGGSLTATVVSGTGLGIGVSVNSKNVPKGTVYGAFSGTSGTLAVPPITLTGRASTAIAQITNLASTDGLVGATVTGPGIPASTTVLAVVVAAIPPSLNYNGQLGTVSISNTPTISSPPANSASSMPQFFVFARTANAILVSGADANATFTGAGILYVGTVQLERSFDGGATWIVCNIGGSGTLAQWSAGTPVSLSFGEPEKLVLYRLNTIAYTSGTINYRISQTGGAAESLAIGQLI
jgi:hypothetical protein